MTIDQLSLNDNVENPPNAKDIGLLFAHEYYTFLNSKPDRLYAFFGNDSMIDRGEEGEDFPAIKGQENIREKIHELGFNNCRVLVTQVDSQMTTGDSVLVSVLGEMSNEGQISQKFMEVFLLAPQEKGYYVLNNIFRFLKDKVSENYINDIQEELEFDPIEDEINSATATYSITEIIVEKEVEELPYEENGLQTLHLEADNKEKKQEMAEINQTIVLEYTPEKTSERALKEDGLALYNVTGSGNDTTNRQRPKKGKESSNKQNQEHQRRNSAYSQDSVQNNNQKSNSKSSNNRSFKTWADLAASNDTLKDTISAQVPVVTLPLRTLEPDFLSQNSPQKSITAADATQMQQPTTSSKSNNQNRKHAPHKMQAGNAAKDQQHKQNFSQKRKEDTQIYVKNVNGISEMQLMEAFSQFGPIVFIKIILPNRQHSYIDFESFEDANKAIKQNKIRVSDNQFVYAEERKNKNYQRQHQHQHQQYSDRRHYENNRRNSNGQEGGSNHSSGNSKRNGGGNGRGSIEKTATTNVAGDEFIPHPKK